VLKSDDLTEIPPSLIEGLVFDAIVKSTFPLPVPLVGEVKLIEGGRVD
jgi:hypothetical protein